MFIHIKSGDLSNIKNFDVCLLNGILSVCHGFTITRTGILLDVGSIRIVLLEGNVGLLGDVEKTLSYDEVFLIADDHDAEMLTFIIKHDDTEVYIHVDLDE